MEEEYFMNTEDRRVRKTKKALQVALAELMTEKELRQITVQELADRADVHRATFYTHYQDVYDLYDKVEKQIVFKVSEMISSEPSHNYSQVYRTVIDYFLENKAFGKMIFGKHGNGSFRQQLCSVIKERYLKIWLYEEPNTQFNSEIQYLTTYHISGCISIIEQWIQDDYVEPKENIYKLLKKVNDGFDQSIG